MGHPRRAGQRAVGLVGYSYGSGNGPINHLRDILSSLTTGVVGHQVKLHMANDFESMSVFKPTAFLAGRSPANVLLPAAGWVPGSRAGIRPAPGGGSG